MFMHCGSRKQDMLMYVNKHQMWLLVQCWQRFPVFYCHVYSGNTLVAEGKITLQLQGKQLASIEWVCKFHWSNTSSIFYSLTIYAMNVQDISLMVNTCPWTTP